jgi:putative colanic acid biosynthesis UDP-glucose lipid carrier transferase
MVENLTNFRTNENAPFLFRIVDVILLIASFFVVSTAYQVPFNKDYLLLLTFTIAVFLFFAESAQLYKKLRLGKFPQRAMVVFAVISLSFLSVTLALFLIQEGGNFSRFIVLSWFIMSLFSLITWRYIYRKIKQKLYKQGVNLRKVAIIGLTPTGKSLLNQIKQYPEMGLDFVGFFDDRTPERLQGDLSNLKGSVEDALAIAQAGELDSVYICIPLTAESRIAHIIHKLSDSTVNVFMVPDFLLNTIMHGNISNLGNMDTISIFESPITGSQEFYKRAFDILFSLSVLVILSPVYLIISILVKITSSGPVVFKQARYGLNGEQIGVYKFRSMKVMENADKVVQATKNDSRITPIGSFLRRTSLDELPQFFNVLLGDMSVVGPRPHAVAHNEEYRSKIDYYMLRHKVKPGITGWAQVNGWRGETDTLDKMEKRVEYDLQYIRNWSLWWDIKIIFLTVFKGFINKNAY